MWDLAGTAVETLDLSGHLPCGARAQGQEWHLWLLSCSVVGHFCHDGGGEKHPAPRPIQSSCSHSWKSGVCPFKASRNHISIWIPLYLEETARFLFPRVTLTAKAFACELSSVSHHFIPGLFTLSHPINLELFDPNSHRDPYLCLLQEIRKAETRRWNSVEINIGLLCKIKEYIDRQKRPTNIDSNSWNSGISEME